MFSIADEVLLNPPPEVVKIIYSDINGIKLTGLSTYTTYKVSVSALSGGGTGVRSGVLYVGKCVHQRMLVGTMAVFKRRIEKGKLPVID